MTVTLKANKDKEKPKVNTFTIETVDEDVDEDNRKIVVKIIQEKAK